MKEETDNPYASEQWIEKTSAPIGVDLSQPAPEMRYQLLEGRVFTLQRFPSGAIAKGELAPSDLDFPVSADGWYGPFGDFLGDDPQFPEWD